MAVKNLNIVLKLQDACKEKNVYKFLNAALLYYCENGQTPTSSIPKLLDDDTSEDEKQKIMYAETIRIQNELIIK